VGKQARDHIGRPKRPAPTLLKGCAAVHDVGYLVQPGEVRRETSGPSDSPEGESRRGQEHVREAGDTRRR
jgi:hypothetical protein